MFISSKKQGLCAENIALLAISFVGVMCLDMTTVVTDEAKGNPLIWKGIALFTPVKTFDSKGLDWLILL